MEEQRSDQPRRQQTTEFILLILMERSMAYAAILISHLQSLTIPNEHRNISIFSVCVTVRITNWTFLQRQSHFSKTLPSEGILILYHSIYSLTKCFELGREIRLGLIKPSL